MLVLLDQRLTAHRAEDMLGRLKDVTEQFSRNTEAFEREERAKRLLQCGVADRSMSQTLTKPCKCDMYNMA